MKNNFRIHLPTRGRRIQSRSAAKKGLRGSDVAYKLKLRGIQVRCDNMGSLGEEASEAYKDVAEVVQVAETGRSQKVARSYPQWH